MLWSPFTFKWWYKLNWGPSEGSVPLGLVVLHAGALAAWSWGQCIIYEIIIRSAMMISNSLVVLDSGQMFWNQSCLERCARWPGFCAEFRLPCRHSRQPPWADPVVGITSEQPHPAQSPSSPAALLSHSKDTPKCHPDSSHTIGKSPLRWDWTAAKECNIFLLFFFFF